VSLFFSSRKVASSAAVLSIGAGCFVLACGANAPTSSSETATTVQSALSAEPRHYNGASLSPMHLALVFDDGPSEQTSDISDYLKTEGIHATFFVNGGHAQATDLPSNLKVIPNAASYLAQLAADGHLVGNHTTTHRDLTTLSDDDIVKEIAQTNTIITGQAGTPWNRSLIHPPFDAWNSNVYDKLKAAGLDNYVGPIVSDIGNITNQYPNAAGDSACFTGGLARATGGLLHDDDPLPDGYATTEECATGYLNEITAAGKGIVLFHEGLTWQDGPSKGNTLDLVKALVPQLKLANFTFVRVDEVPQVAADLPPCSEGCTTCRGPTNTECLACEKGKHLSKGDCVSCAVCPAGTFTATACTEGADTLCSACGPDTYSSAGAETCTSCASCDDQNPCTSDTCSPTTGCSHAPIDGCTQTVADGGTAPDAAPPADDASSCSATPRGTRASTASAFAAAAALAVTARRRARKRKNSR
jgi:peptidoglycan/xylan/chitin deacetylase (PgdA/CDA1 family)